MGLRTYKCCICNNSFKGYGNDPNPLKDTGKCCNNCNLTKVIPERMKHMKVGNFAIR